MYFWKYAIIYEKIVPVEKSVKRASNKWAFFLLSTSIICISFCHLAAKSPVMGYICWCMLYAAFLLPLPLSYAESQANIHYSIPSLLLTSQLSAEWSHENQARTPGSRQSMITCTLCLSNWAYIKTVYSAELFLGRRHSFYQFVAKLVPAGLPVL